MLYVVFSTQYCHKGCAQAGILAIGAFTGCGSSGSDTKDTKEAKRICKTSNILGAHLEGPFLSPEMCGANDWQLWLICFLCAAFVAILSTEYYV